MTCSIKRIATTFVLALCPCVCGASEDEWTLNDTLAQALVTGVLVLDEHQTLAVSRNPGRYHETNSLMGCHPSAERVRGYFGVMVVGSAAVSWALPSPYRRVFQASEIAVEANVVRKNVTIGLKARF